MSDEPTKHDRKEATVWATMAKEVREYDQDNVKRGKGDIDTLLVFAGLFSAVLASFLVAVYPSLQPSPTDVMNYTLQRIANQTASYNFTDGRMIATNPSSPPPPFQASAEDIRVNVLWFASLIISLITSSFGMLVKQWMDDILAVDIPEPQAHLRLRHYRMPQIETWMVYEIVACLPLLLHLSLGLFFVGLCYFTAAIHASIGYTTLPLVIGWTLCLFSTTALPIFFPRCPYNISLFKPVIARFHRALSHLADWLHQVLTSPPEDPWVLPLREQRTGLCATVQRAWGTISSALQNIPDEAKVAKDSAADLKIFSEVDAMRANDEILGTIIAEELPWISPTTTDAVSFALGILAHRVPTVAKSECLLPEWPFRDPFPLALVRAQVKDKVYKILDNHAVLDQTPYNKRTTPIFLRQQDKSPNELQQDMILYTLTMIISDEANSPEIKLPPNIVNFLRRHLCSESGPVVCRDVLSLMIWHCTGVVSCQDTTVRLVKILARLAVHLELPWKARKNHITSILCLAIDFTHNQRNSRPHLTWNYSDDGFGTWEGWSIPDDAPDSLKAAILEYLFILVSAEFKQVEDLKGSSPEASAHQETPEVLCCALRHFMKYDGGYLTSSGFQAFVDLVSMKSEELMGIVIESLVSTDLVDAQNSALKYYDLWFRWPKGAYNAIRRVSHIKPSSTALDESFATLSFVVGKKLGFTTADHPTPNPDINIHQCLSLCHIAIFLYVTIHAQPDRPELGQELFSSIADTLKRKTEGCGAKIFNDEVASQLAYDCLYIMDCEQEHDGWYNEWLVVFSRSRKTSFPDTLVEVLGRFIPNYEVTLLFRLRELRNRPHWSAQSPVDTLSGQQAGKLEVRLTEQDENPAVAAVDKSGSMTHTYPSIVQDLPIAGPSTGVESEFKDEGRSEGESGLEGAVDKSLRETMEEYEPKNKASRSAEDIEGRPNDDVS